MNLDDILHERLAIVGGTGSGKSYTARGLAERVLGRGGRLGVIDPTGVWHGLRVRADGRPGFPVVIFGGERSDVPLLETAGRVIAHAVATTHQSWVIDTAALKTKAAERRFMLDFLDALFETNREDITLIVDEADRFSPQRMSPEVARLHERMEEIVRRGRVKGFTPWLITQRPASLNKDVLSQATAYISMRLTGSHDRKALEDVIEGQADKTTAKAIYDAMPRHKVGSGLVWAPQQDILTPVQFPKIQTADTMRAPKPGERISDKALPPIDLGKLKEQLATVEAEAKANDPRALKAEVTRLTRELAAKPRAEAPPGALQAQYEKGYRRGRIEASAELRSIYGDRIREATALLSAPVPAVAQDVPPAPRQPPPVRAAPVPRVPRAAVNGTGGPLPKAERLILTVLAQRQPERVPVDRVAAIAGYSAGGGGFNNSLSALRSKGYIEQGHPLMITGEGLEALGDYDPLPTGPDLLRHWTGRLGKAERSALEAVAELGGEASKDRIAQHAGYAVDGGGFNNALSRLRTLGLIEGSGTLRLHEDLQ